VSGDGSVSCTVFVVLGYHCNSIIYLQVTHDDVITLCFKFERSRDTCLSTTPPRQKKPLKLMRRFKLSDTLGTLYSYVHGEFIIRLGLAPLISSTLSKGAGMTMDTTWRIPDQQVLRVQCGYSGGLVGERERVADLELTTESLSQTLEQCGLRSMVLLRVMMIEREPGVADVET